MNPIKSYLYGAIAIAVLSALGYVYWLHESNEKNKATAIAEREKKEAAIQAIATIQESANADRKLLEGYQSVKTEIKIVDKIVTQQVIKYRDVVSVRTVVPPEFVRAYNDSTEHAHQENSPTGVNGATGAFTKVVNDADLLEVVTSNNRLCVKQAAQLTALQKWAASL